MIEKREKKDDVCKIALNFQGYNNNKKKKLAKPKSGAPGLFLFCNKLSWLEPAIQLKAITWSADLDELYS